MKLSVNNFCQLLWKCLIFEVKQKVVFRLACSNYEIVVWSFYDIKWLDDSTQLLLHRLHEELFNCLFRHCTTKEVLAILLSKLVIVLVKKLDECYIKQAFEVEEMILGKSHLLQYQALLSGFCWQAHIRCLPLHTRCLAQTLKQKL